MVGWALWTAVLSAAGSSLITTLVREITVAVVRPVVGPSGAASAAAPGVFGAPLPTCPASCPGPSFDFCVEPLLDFVADTVADWEQNLWEARFYVAVVLLVIGAFLLGRWTAPPQARRPHGRRWPDARAGGRFHD